MPRLRTCLPFLLPLITVPLALLLTYEFGPRVIGPETLFFAAVTFCAWYGGLVPGLIATVLAASLSAWFFFNPVTGNRLDIDDLARAAVFLLVSILTSSLHTAQRRTEEKLRESRDIAMAANKAKDRFLATLSHELRNPLNPVIQIATLMEQNGTLPAQVREDATTIRRNVDLEAHLIDDLLDFNRIERGKLRIERKLIDTNDLIHDVLRICRQDIVAKALSATLDRKATRHGLYADPTRFRQIIWNILKNAIKFTPDHGQIRIASRNERRHDSDSLIIEIVDTGIGIDPASIDNIFQPFEQLSESVTQRFGGLGLGLAITKSLVQSHGGQISATSHGLNQGTTFTLQFPDAQTAPRKPAPPPSHPRPSKLTPMRILLIEDHVDSAKILARILRREMHQVELAGSIDEALKAAQSHGFDLVISDVGLPDGSGRDLMRQLHDKYDIPGIALSGYGSEEDLAQSRRAGFVRHLTKPVDLAQLEDALNEVQSHLHPAT